MQNKYL